MLRVMRIASLALMLVGCIAPTSEPTTDQQTGEQPGQDDPQPPAPVASGAYQLRTNIGLTVEAILPQTAADAVVTLRSFAQNPARTLFDLAAAAGVPAVQQIRDALPSYVEDKLEGWINAEIEQLTFGGVPVPALAGNIASLAETALSRFALDSKLVVTGGSATHTLETLDLTPAGIDVRYAIEALPSDVIAATTTCSSADGKLSLGEHGYAIEYGEYVWRAVNQAVAAQHGMDIRGTLGAAVNCPALADVVAQKCYWSYCVGHKAELIEICEAGLDLAVDKMHEKFAEKRIDALHFAAGTANLVDANRDGAVEALSDGVWTAEINVGQGLRHAPATFTATK